MATPQSTGWHHSSKLARVGLGGLTRRATVGREGELRAFEEESRRREEVLKMLEGRAVLSSVFQLRPEKGRGCAAAHTTEGGRESLAARGPCGETSAISAPLTADTIAGSVAGAAYALHTLYLCRLRLAASTSHNVMGRAGSRILHLARLRMAASTRGRSVQMAQPANVQTHDTRRHSRLAALDARGEGMIRRRHYGVRFP